MNKFNATPHSDFWTDVNGQMYFTEAPWGISGNYGVFSFVDESPEYYFSTTMMDETLVQFDLFSDSTSPDTVKSMFSHLRTVYDDAVIGISGFDPYKFEYDDAWINRFPEDNTWVYTVQYRCIEGR